MASQSYVELINGALTTTTTGDKVSLPRSKDFIGTLVVSGNTGTVDCVIQHSPDGVNWFTLGTFAQIAVGTGSEALNITIPVLPNVRGVATLSANATVELRLHFDGDR